jgi:hypothetical protein
LSRIDHEPTFQQGLKLFVSAAIFWQSRMGFLSGACPATLEEARRHVWCVRASDRCSFG